MMYQYAVSSFCVKDKGYAATQVQAGHFSIVLLLTHCCV